MPHRTSEKPTRDLDEWDAEIEAEFQRVARQPKAASREHKSRFIGAPLPFVSDVCRLTEGRTTLLVALCIYRRMCICNSRTVTLPSAELAVLGIDRYRKREALAKLRGAGLIKVKNAIGRTSRITLIWR